MSRALCCVLVLFITCEVATAGGVTARVSGGQLYVYGDQGDNSIAIDSPQPGQIRVIGFTSGNSETTSVNGQFNGTATLSGWTGGIFTYMYAGSDSVTLENAVVRGAAHFDLGDGDDELFIGALPDSSESSNFLEPQANQGFVDLQSSLYVLGSNGDDYVSVLNATVRGYATFDLGNGADEIVMGDSTLSGTVVEFLSNCVVLPGGGSDRAAFAATVMRRDFIFDDSTSTLQLSLIGVNIDQNAFIYGTSSVDSMFLDNVHVGRLLQLFSEGDADFVGLSTISCGTLEIFSGGGADSVELDAVTAETLRVFLDAGADMLEINAGMFKRIYGYGASDNDLFTIRTTQSTEMNLFGDGGTDSLVQTGNTIGTTRLYSIENK